MSIENVKKINTYELEESSKNNDEFLMIKKPNNETENEKLVKISKGNLLNDINNSISTINNDMNTINNEINKIESFNNINILKESKVFATSVWTNSDADNCILSDDTFAGLTYYKCTKNYTSLRQNVTLNANTKYTLSFWAYSSKEGSLLRAFNSNLEGNNPTGQQIYVDIPNVGAKWKRYTVVFDIKGTYTACIRIEPTNLQDGGSDFVLIAGMTLMEGECVDFGWIGNPSDQNWKYLSSGTDIVKQPDGRYCGTGLYHAPPTMSDQVAFYYEMTTYGRNSKYKKLHAWNTTYNIEYTATMNNGTWSNWSVTHKEDEVYNFNLTSAPSTNVINISSLYCNNSIDLHFIASGVTGGNGNPTCSFYFWYDNNGTNTQGNIPFQLPVNVNNSNKAPVSLKVKLIKMNDNTWMVNLDCIRNGSGYNTFSKCTLVTGTNIKIKTCNISTNNQNIKFETPCLIVRYN